MVMNCTLEFRGLSAFSPHIIRKQNFKILTWYTGKTQQICVLHVYNIGYSDLRLSNLVAWIEQVRNSTVSQ